MRATFIRPIAICLFYNNNRILVFEGYDSVKDSTFCRPLGGGIEPGEFSRDAVAREIREELGVEIENLRLLTVIENIFTFEGDPWHEIVFIFDASFVDTSLYEQSVVRGYEHEIDKAFDAKWKSLGELADKRVRLVPEGLLDLIHEKLLV